MSNAAAAQHQMLLDAVAHHQSGRYQQAEAGYRQILQHQPNHPDALNLLGVLALRAGQATTALSLISRSVQIAPSFGSLSNLGESYRHLGRLDEAIGAYRQALALNPQHGDTHANLSLALAQAGRSDEAIQSLQRAVELMPMRGDLHDRLGGMFLQHGDPYRAIVSHRKALAINPNSAPAHANLGLALAKKSGAMDEAIAECRKAVELAPDAPDAHRILATVFENAERYAEAADAFARAIALNPNNPEIHARRGVCLEKLDRLDEATAATELGIKYFPNEPRLFANLSCVLRKRMEFDQSVVAADRAVALAPNFSEAHGHLSLALLSLGDYEKGFAEYEWRWRCDNFTTKPRDFKQPIWDGSDPAGRTIFVHTEQGFGDTIQFARYLPMLADRGATVVLEAPHQLRKLLSRTGGVSRVIATGLGIPDTDLHTPLLSLPKAFGTTLETIPNDVPYLNADPKLVEKWTEKLRSAANGKRCVGLIWAGNAIPDRKRTVAARFLSPLGGFAKIQLFSLQKKSAETYEPAPADLNLIDLDADLTDFDETAAAMTALDLIITIDTGPAHLAGALGRPTLTMLPWSPDWRWLPFADVSRWYPTMRLFKQTKDGEWGDVIERVRDEMKSWHAP